MRDETPRMLDLRRSVALFALFIPAACASSAAQVGPPAPLARQNSESRATATLYAAGPNTNLVNAYPAYADNPPAVGQITDGLFAPTGMTVDRKGNLYVCNNAGQSSRAGKGFWTVTVYHRGDTTPFRTYTNGVWNPVDVAVAADGTAFIANFGNGVVTVYPPKSVDPSLTLVGVPNAGALGIALDAGGDAFVSYVKQSGGSGRVYEYLPGQATGTDLGIAFSGEPHGLAIDNAGNLIVAVSKAPNPGSTIQVYAPGSTQPKQTLSGTFQPFMLALDRDNRRLFVADYGSGNNDGGVFVYSYPKGKLLYKDVLGAAAGAYGVALDPR